LELGHARELDDGDASGGLGAFERFRLTAAHQIVIAMSRDDLRRLRDVRSRISSAYERSPSRRT